LSGMMPLSSFEQRYTLQALRVASELVDLFGMKVPSRN
jgi:hypothetical protein